MSASTTPYLTPEQIDALAAESKQPVARGIILAFTILSSVVVILRYITRLKLIKNPGLEDYLIGIAMSASIAMAVCMLKQISYGTGLHLMFLTLPQIEGSLRYLYGSILAYVIGITFTKLSILLQYRRLFVSGRTHRATCIAIAVVAAYGTEAFFTGLLTCVPIKAFWSIQLQATPGAARCLPIYPLWYTNAILNVATDLMLATLPLPAIRSLQMPQRQKSALMIVFGIGWFACIVSILRFRALTVFEKHMDDSSWYSTEAAYWSCIETNVAIMCASLPALKPLLAKVFPQFVSVKQYSNSQSSEAGHAIGNSRSDDGGGKMVRISGGHAALLQKGSWWTANAGRSVDMGIVKEGDWETGSERTAVEPTGVAQSTAVGAV